MKDYLIVLNKDENTVSFVNEVTKKIEKIIDVGIHPDGMAFCRVKE